ncbi:MAG TPA: amidohydrolase family protein [Magnetovibrio sp.]
MRFLHIAVLFALVLIAQAVHAEEQSDLYFVDAHSQMPGGFDQTKIIGLMDQAGVHRTILSARNDREPQDVAEFAALHPDRITAAVRTKGKFFNTNSPKFAKQLNMQLQNPVFKAMAESLLFHAQKGKKAPKIDVAADSPQNQLVLNATLERGWPFIAHYEFSATGWDKSKYMDAFEAMASAHADHPFVLIHMGQLDADEAQRLIEAHPNVYFLTSHSNTVSIAENPGQPWVNLFSGDTLAPDWAALMTRHSDRFILAFDNVWPEHWGRLYLDEAKLWRGALANLPADVAHAVAHGNAERLWNLPPRP